MQDSTARNIYSAVVGLASIILLITSIRYVQAAEAGLEARKIVQVSTSFEEIKAPLDKDLSIRPSHPESVLLLNSLYQSLYQQSQDEGFFQLSTNLLNQVLEDEPHNKSMLNQLVKSYEMNRQPEQAYEILINNAYKFKWDINWYEQIINKGYDLGMKALGKGTLPEKKSTLIRQHQPLLKYKKVSSI